MTTFFHALASMATGICGVRTRVWNTHTFYRFPEEQA
jgi:hypothetical protein